jgi:hypothetical protein
MAENPVPVEALSPAALKYAGPNAPLPAKMMAARGLAPLLPRDLVAVVALLGADPDPQVSELASKTLGSLPERILVTALGERLPPKILDAVARRLADQPNYVELLLLNQATEDETVCFLASKAKERQLEIIAQNEQRLLRFPRIIEALYMNPQTRMSTVDRVMELAVRNGIELSGIPVFKEVQAAILGVRGEAEPPPAPEPTPPQAVPPAADSRPLEKLAESWPPEAPSQPAPEPVRLDELRPPPAPTEPLLTELSSEEIATLVDERCEGEAEAPAADAIERRESMTFRISKMTVSQRIRFAVLGNREVRSYLMRDTNRLVAASAIKNPRVTEQEVVTIAQSRSVNDEVIRIVASSREWTKNYRIRLNLVNNPKCPLPSALTLLRSLRANDVKAIAKNKNVPTAVSGMAKRLSTEIR